MKKYKRLISMIVTACVFAGVVYIALSFTGIVNPLWDDRYDNDPALVDETDRDTSITEKWQIVWKGFEFFVESVGQAMIHQSGCLNIRSCDEYLIQIDVEEESLADFWENRDEKTHYMEAIGYGIQLEPEQIQIDGHEYIRYIVKLDQERGSDFDSSYFYVLLSEASEEKRFLATIRFDGIDVATLDAEERSVLYEKALEQTSDVISSARPADRNDDVAGSYWQEEEPVASLSEDSFAVDEITISYRIPEQYDLVSDDEAGKRYYSEDDRTYVTTSVIPYSWLTAEEMAENPKGAGISKIITEGDYEINGIQYYYYTYSIMYIKGDEKSYSYHFHAFADLKNGDIYSIHGFTDTNSRILNKEYLYNFMNIEETGND